MHELGIVFHVIDSLEKIKNENNITEIKVVTLELGEVSGVLDTYLIECWNWAIKKSDFLKNSRLEIETIKAVTICEKCNHEYSTVTYGKKCPNCQSENTHLITGNETNILRIEGY